MYAAYPDNNNKKRCSLTLYGHHHLMEYFKGCLGTPLDFGHVRLCFTANMVEPHIVNCSYAVAQSFSSYKMLSGTAGHRSDARNMRRHYVANGNQQLQSDGARHNCANGVKVAFPRCIYERGDRVCQLLHGIRMAFDYGAVCTRAAPPQ
jgi:hypothetical protein